MFHLPNYSGLIQDCLGAIDGGERLMPLAPKAAVAPESVARLTGASESELMGGEDTGSSEFVECVRAAALLYLSALEDSHRISQSIGSDTGSFLHGIMHRQEPDYSNAKYWFRRTGKHELFPTLREDAVRLPLKADELRASIRAKKEWDSLWFVDLCEQGAQAGGSLEADLLMIQRLEWQLLFDYCYRRALVG